MSDGRTRTINRKQNIGRFGAAWWHSQNVRNNVILPRADRRAYSKKARHITLAQFSVASGLQRWWEGYEKSTSNDLPISTCAREEGKQLSGVLHNLLLLRREMTIATSQSLNGPLFSPKHIP
eukprot:477806-Amphidinium_carterae.1